MVKIDFIVIDILCLIDVYCKWVIIFIILKMCYFFFVLNIVDNII